MFLVPRNVYERIHSGASAVNPGGRPPSMSINQLNVNDAERINIRHDVNEGGGKKKTTTPTERSSRVINIPSTRRRGGERERDSTSNENDAASLMEEDDRGALAGRDSNRRNISTSTRVSENDRESMSGGPRMNNNSQQAAENDMSVGIGDMTPTSNNSRQMDDENDNEPLSPISNHSFRNSLRSNISSQLPANSLLSPLRSIRRPLSFSDSLKKRIRGMNTIVPGFEVGPESEPEEDDVFVAPSAHMSTPSSFRGQGSLSRHSTPREKSVASPKTPTPQRRKSAAAVAAVEHPPYIPNFSKGQKQRSNLSKGGQIFSEANDPLMVAKRKKAFRDLEEKNPRAPFLSTPTITPVRPVPHPPRERPPIPKIGKIPGVSRERLLEAIAKNPLLSSLRLQAVRDIENRQPEKRRWSIQGEVGTRSKRLRAPFRDLREIEKNKNKKKSPPKSPHLTRAYAKKRNLTPHQYHADSVFDFVPRQSIGRKIRSIAKELATSTATKPK